MTTVPIPFRDRFIRTGARGRRRLAALSLLVAGGVAAASVYVYSVVAAPARRSSPASGTAATHPARSPCFEIGGGSRDPREAPDLPRRRRAGATHRSSAKPGWDKHTFGEAVTTPRVDPPSRRRRAVERSDSARRGLAERRLRRAPDLARRHSDYAPFILRPKRLGTAPVLVIEPTNTWHAYNALDGDSWYMNPDVHVIDLTHPFTDHTSKAGRHPPGSRSSSRSSTSASSAGTGRAATAPTSSPTTTSRTSRTSSSSSATS